MLGSCGQMDISQIGLISFQKLKPLKSLLEKRNFVRNCNAICRKIEKN